MLSRSPLADPICQCSLLAADGETHTLPAPADGAVEYADTLFTSDFREDNVYVRDSAEEVDSAWTTLYDGSVILRVYIRGMHAHAYAPRAEFGLSQISRSEARRLPNKTLPVPADPASKH